LKAIGGQNHRLGVGAPAGGGDYALKLLAVEWLRQDVKPAMV